MSVIQRLKTSVGESGVFGTIRKAFRYVWRTGTRPLRSWLKRRRNRRAKRGKTIKAPSLQSWLQSYGDMRPEPSPEPTTRFSVVCPVYNTDPAMLRAAVESVVAQTYDNWELVLIDDASPSPRTRSTLEELTQSDGRIQSLTNETNLGIARTTQRGIEAATGEYIVFLDHDDELAPTALEWCATCAPEADLIYSDEMKIDEKGNASAPFFKPAWSPRLLTGVNYVNHLTCVRRSRLLDVGGVREGFEGAQDHDMLFRLTEGECRVAHLPNLLYRWRAWAGSVAGTASSKVGAEQSGLKALQESIDRRGWQATAGLGSGSPFNYRVRWTAGADQPTTKVIIPTRDRLELLRVAVHGVLERTEGVDMHLVIVNNGSTEEETLEYLGTVAERDDVTVVNHDDAFNYSRLVNIGVEAGPQADFIVLLNNDIEVRHRGWLRQMTGWFVDPEVIAVGTKLRFPGGRIQHAGVVIGLGGIAGHYALGFREEPMLGNLHDQAREVGCATAACLVMRTEAFVESGGFNEDLPIDFQDVDLCLKLRHHLGGTIVYDPTYPLTHIQGASRGVKDAANAYTVSRMHFLWADELAAGDPYYNPHLTLEDHTLRLGSIPGDEATRRARLQPRWS